MHIGLPGKESQRDSVGLHDFLLRIRHVGGIGGVDWVMLHQPGKLVRPGGKNVRNVSVFAATNFDTD